jgi:CRP-like cAMP-binding protein
MDICACITLEQYPARSLVFEQDDTRCDKAYIVLEGTVQVYQRQSSDVFEKAEDE